MPQMMLPIFPAGVTEINDKLAFKKEDGVVTYFSATMPVFHHSENDIASFKMMVRRASRRGKELFNSLEGCKDWWMTS